MAHVLAKIKGANSSEMKRKLNEDKHKHETNGLFLEHLWHNANDNDELFFLFRSDDISKAQQFIQSSHTEAYMNNLEANLPHITFLVEQ